MINLNVMTKDSSTDFQAQLQAMGLFVTQFNGEVHVEGDEATVQQAQSLVVTYDFAAGVAKDVQAVFEKAVQAHLDSEAQLVGYDTILSACSYAGYANPFQAEGQSFVAWRGNVWAYCYAQLDEVTAGNRTKPTVDEFILELPVLA